MACVKRSFNTLYIEGGWYQAVAVDSKGLLAVTDVTNKCIHLILKDEATLLRSIGKGVLGSNLFGVAFDLNGNVWVTDYTNCKAVKLSQQGQLIQAMYQTGSDGVRFHNPFGVCVSQEGMIYIYVYFKEILDQEYPDLHYCH